MAATNAATVTVPCRCDHCPNYLTVSVDSYVPDPWMCPQCEDDQHAQQIEEQNQRRERDAEITELNLELAAYYNRNSK